MKTRNGFVSNSSSSSFIIAVIERPEVCPCCKQKKINVLKDMPQDAILEESSLENYISTIEQEISLLNMDNKMIEKKLVDVNRVMSAPNLREIYDSVIHVFSDKTNYNEKFIQWDLLNMKDRHAALKFKKEKLEKEIKEKNEILEKLNKLNKSKNTKNTKNTKYKIYRLDVPDMDIKTKDIISHIVENKHAVIILEKRN